MTSNSALIISFGRRRRLLSKPANYTNLLECARRLFSELQGLQDEEIIFYFKPEWFDEELELDESAFEQVHNRAQLRIGTRKMPTSNSPKRLLDKDEEATSTKMEPDQKRAKIGNPQQDPCGDISPPASAYAAAIAFVDNNPDFFLASTSTPSNLPAAAVNTRPGAGLLVGVGETANPQRSRQDIGTALRDDHSDPMADSLCAACAPYDSPTHDAFVQSRAALPAPNATAAQDQSLDGMKPGPPTDPHFPVDVNSPTRYTCPTRQVLTEEWVGCRKPLAAVDEAASDQFSVRLLTERHAIRFTFESGYVLVATLLEHAVKLGYLPIPIADIDELRLSASSTECFITRDGSFHYNGIVNGSDVYVIADDRPGVHLFPSDPSGESSSPKPMPGKVRISLKLSSELKFSSLYPWAAIKEVGQGEEVKWEVSTNSQGDIISQVGEEKYYGGPYWKLSPSLESATTLPPNKQTPSSSPPQPPSDLLARLLNPSTSVVLPVENTVFTYVAGRRTAGYLVKVLETQLQLPVHIGTRFASHFLCDKYKQQLDAEPVPRSIAMTFVPQEQMEKIAPLRITPAPATTRRIFMLWGAVSTESSTGRWREWYGPELSLAAALEKKDWAPVVGLDLERDKQENEFTAVEWGMMRVPESYLVKD